MNTATPNHHGFSADVRMHLSINGHVLTIGQLGPDFIILRDPIDHPPTRAEITVSIDGQEQRWPIHLPDGITVTAVQTSIAPSA
jgi:hypothetical protein